MKYIKEFRDPEKANCVAGNRTANPATQRNS